MKFSRRTTNRIGGIALVFIALTGVVCAQTPGKDGNKNVNSTEIVNIYTTLTADASWGGLTINVASNAGFSAGDLMMIYQAQGATISEANDATYGTVTNYNNAGKYEVVGVASLSGTTLITAAKPLENSYTAAGRVQVVRIPQYGRLRVQGGGTITAPAWDGQTGGIVAIHVENTTTINGAINVSGQGFRGGQLSVCGAASSDFAVYRSSSALDGAEKGEGIAGPASVLSSGAYGRGAPANAGGGGNTHNAGGGGAANGSSGGTWTGQGVMCGSCTGTSAWLLDSAYILNGNSPTTSPGGGRGGYTYSMGNQDALTLGPGNSSWGGNYRRERGGLGGHPLYVEPCSRVYFGGGGGSGNANNNSGGAGGNGGGIVLLIGSIVTGTGTISANGADGANTTNTHNDAPGGAGAGGTIIVSASQWITDVTLTANGGNGGNQLITNTEGEGPGGGGGGGVIITPVTTATRSVDGGFNGLTSSSALTEFPANGATSGNSGEFHITGCSSFLPVELTSFAARSRNSVVTLEWHTATETNNFGFEIERRIDENPWETIGFVDGAGTTNAPKSYRFDDKSSNTWKNAASLTYRLRQIDRDGSIHFSPTVDVPLHGEAVSMELSVAPNPIRDAGSIRLNIAHEGIYSIAVYNMAGKEVASLAREAQFSPGSYSFPLSLTHIPSGSYLVVLQSATGVITYPFGKL